MASGSDTGRQSAATVAEGIKHALELHRKHRQHGQSDAVELVKAAPGACSSDALERCGQRAARHLIGAVVNKDGLAHVGAEILRAFRLARAGRASGCAAKSHVERLRERDVDAVGERRDDETRRIAEVLPAIGKRHVANIDPNLHRKTTGR